MNRERRNQDFYDDELNGLGVPIVSTGLERGESQSTAEDEVQFENDGGLEEFNDEWEYADIEEMDCEDRFFGDEATFNNESKCRAIVLEVARLLEPLNLSENSIRLVFEAAKLISEGSVTITELSDAKKEAFEKFVEPQTQNLCSKCFHRLSSSKKVCMRVECDYYR
uniref:Phorbol-ester/DAG-type domain-containing protein n=1 Tax=Caenorhabditis tropicalis TaxID=1561998 RepID=A0A1I7TMG9_9PELO